MDYNEKIDYSSISTYMSCPREFLFQYIMHLRPAGQSIHLVFGSCYHYGLESTYNILKDDPNISVMDATKNSINAFNSLWKLDGEPFWKDEDLIFPKSPGHAANMYKKYWERFLKLDTNQRKIIAVEAPFALDLNIHGSTKALPRYIGRMDLVLSDGNNGIEVIDHKTAKAIYKTSTQSYESSFQTDGYLTAGRIFYDKIPSITYRISLCQKSKIDFIPITINKRAASIEHFLSNLVHYITEIQKNLTLFEEDKVECTQRNDILKSFPRKPGYSCTSFSTTCAYYDLCRIRNNPLLWLDHAPQGFHFSEWDPDKINEETQIRLKEIS
ncbi:MAG TPA: PD-(D/E)XK nuclease family protein [Candidatus Izemoplasmatales bacterium]|nr:PD-(D/E)XK nuclease family protein [Candidatus Izemoplasmatales bacterium]